MFAVIFEVEPKPERRNDYLALGRALNPQVETIDGFIDIDRFANKRAEGRLMSLSTWRNADAVARWRAHAAHRSVQEKGRGEIFLDYHLRVGEVTSDTEAPDGVAPRPERCDETEVGIAKIVTVTDVIADDTGRIGEAPDLVAGALGLDVTAAGLVAHEIFESIYRPGKLALLLSWRDADAANAWNPVRPASVQALRHRHVRIVRDYGMFERREAPQFYPEVKRPEAERGTPKRAASA